MALIRGINSAHPCPICLVPGDKLDNLSARYPLRSTEDMKNIYNQAKELQNKGDAEQLLKSYGLRQVEVNIFSKL